MRPERFNENKSDQNFLLTPPKDITSEEIEKMERRWCPSFYGENRVYKFEYHNGRAGFNLIIHSDLPGELTREERQKFTVENRGGKKIFIYSVGEIDTPEESGITLEFPPDYHVAQPRNFYKETKEPNLVSSEEVTEFIKNKNILFYTGAGISAARGLGMSDFMKPMGIDISRPSDDFLKKALNNPRKVLEQFVNYCRTAFEGVATPAHLALAELAKIRSNQIMTECFDFLHERSGIQPYRTERKKMDQDIRPEWLKEIDATVCVGLSYDDRGFLSWYKANNPLGKIIAIDFHKPSYLDDEDLFLRGDLQQVLPEIVQLVKK